MKSFLFSFVFLFTSVLFAENSFFPIMPWDSIPNDPAVLKKIKDCGFTIAGFVPTNALEACRKAGLKAIVYDARTAGYNWTNVDVTLARSNVTSLVKQVGKNPAVFGYYLRDEPEAGWFPHLEKVASRVRELAPGKWPYINLFPDYAENWQLGTTNYAEYLERFISTCHPKIVSYDNYALMNDGSVRESFWTNIEAVRSATKRHGLDFWNIVLAVPHYDYRQPTAADFRFQIFSTLAYGGRGISYFTYFSPAGLGGRSALLDSSGHATPAWTNVQSVNLQVQKLAPTLLQLASDDVYHFGKIPAGCHGPTSNSLVTAVVGDNFLVGEFTHRNGSRYVMVMNKNLTKAQVCEPQFRKPPKRLQYVSPDTGELKKYKGEAVTLAPGQGVLLKPEW